MSPLCNSLSFQDGSCSWYCPKMQWKTLSRLNPSTFVRKYTSIMDHVHIEKKFKVSLLTKYYCVFLQKTDILLGFWEHRTYNHNRPITSRCEMVLEKLTLAQIRNNMWNLDHLLSKSGIYILTINLNFRVKEIWFWVALVWCYPVKAIAILFLVILISSLHSMYMQILC